MDIKLEDIRLGDYIIPINKLQLEFRHKTDMYSITKLGYEKYGMYKVLAKTKNQPLVRRYAFDLNEIKEVLKGGNIRENYPEYFL